MTRCDSPIGFENIRGTSASDAVGRRLLGTRRDASRRTSQIRSWREGIVRPAGDKALPWSWHFRRGAVGPCWALSVTQRCATQPNQPS